MITATPSGLESAQWHRELAEAVDDPMQLLKMLRIDPSDLPQPILTRTEFPLRVTRYFVGLMRSGDPRDPLLAQVLPVSSEQQPIPGYSRDPVGDLAACRESGVLQKYQGRALLIATGACAVHCRYCFRRHYPYSTQSVLRHWDRVLATLNKMPDTRELILSGGDPLSLSDQRLDDLIQAAEQVPHLHRLRIHTRLPVVLPSRVTRSLVNRLSGSRLRTVMVLHINHPNEISARLAEALLPLRTAGISLLNQAVLLKSINDDAATLQRLSESLFDVGVLPYYLHMLDPVDGAAHFGVDPSQARELLETLRIRLPGYLVPRMVREIAGEPYKSPL